MGKIYSTLIESHELEPLLKRRNSVLFDCRFSLADPGLGERQYRESHISGAHYLHLDRDLSGPVTGQNGRHPLPDSDEFAARLAQLGVAAGVQVIAYDQDNSMLGARVWWMLQWLGHEAAAVLNGGFARWTAEGRPVTATVPALPAPRKKWWPHIAMRTVDANYIQRHLQPPEMTIVDGRAADRFRGENEPVDSIAGHIPGALNRPYTANLGCDGRFKPASELRAEFLELLAGRDPATVVHQCGSGVSACHNLLAMRLAGLSKAATLYPGSWSEWCSDPARPVAKGGSSY
jgi:thiosulfate/3-mercaptopyruvate sulfurtransferase